MAAPSVAMDAILDLASESSVELSRCLGPPVNASRSLLVAALSLAATASACEDDAIGGLDGLVRRMADKRFADLGIDREEVQEFLAAAPQIAAAFARLYDTGGGERLVVEDTTAAARRAIERWQNHFSDLDHAAEDLADELRLSRGEISAALGERLREKHRMTVRILPAEVMPGQVHRLPAEGNLGGRGVSDRQAQRQRADDAFVVGVRREGRHSHRSGRAPREAKPPASRLVRAARRL